MPFLSLPPPLFYRSPSPPPLSSSGPHRKWSCATDPPASSFSALRAPVSSSQPSLSMAFRPFAKTPVVTDVNLLTFGLSDVLDILRFYGLLVFVEMIPEGFPSLVQEFYLNFQRKWSDTGFLEFVTSTIQHVELLLTPSTVLSLLAIVQHVEPEIPDHSIVPLLGPFFFPSVHPKIRKYPKQLSPGLFSSLSHRVLHWIISAILFPRSRS